MLTNVFNKSFKNVFYVFKIFFNVFIVVFFVAVKTST